MQIMLVLTLQWYHLSQEKQTLIDRLAFFDALPNHLQATQTEFFTSKSISTLVIPHIRKSLLIHLKHK